MSGHQFPSLNAHDRSNIHAGDAYTTQTNNATVQYIFNGSHRAFSRAALEQELQRVERELLDLEDYVINLRSMLNKPGPSASESVASTLPTPGTESTVTNPEEPASSRSKDIVPTMPSTPQSGRATPHPRQSDLDDAPLPRIDDFDSVVTLTWTYQWSRTVQTCQENVYEFVPEFKRYPVARDLIFGMYINKRETLVVLGQQHSREIGNLPHKCSGQSVPQEGLEVV
ncbi:hypothetical protein LTR70_010219 [Exophiala xenobiotica]|uniref:Uncharacterized protein n=1 Tax=Lithohypha guttulata TaxID=1690604 RepID=A0ABR0JV59_9EURO|nr:hypothetical protein LTR24_010050 [Lithohypha guttulata]KAK5309524.1 hypothetical protein LTR70_010219 [Exophiala xenobiotica]